jgi:uncharacterized protein YwbE
MRDLLLIVVNTRSATHLHGYHLRMEAGMTFSFEA